MEQGGCVAIVLAGGSGLRMGGSLPKQYLPLGEHTVLYEALSSFEESSLIDRIVVVAGKDTLEDCKKAAQRENSKICSFVVGGKERYDSVYAGLLACEGAEVVLIHDGARPFCDGEIIQRCVEAAYAFGACAAGMPSKDTVKLTDLQGVVEDTPERSRVWIVQTPQAFRYDLIRVAHEKLREGAMAGVTDDAMMVERMGGVSVHMVEGSYSNIKLTTPEDMVVARALYDERHGNTLKEGEESRS